MSTEDPQTSKELLAALISQAKELFESDEIVSFAIIAVTEDDTPLLSTATTSFGSMLGLVGAVEAAKLDLLDTITAVDSDEEELDS